MGIMANHFVEKSASAVPETSMSGSLELARQSIEANRGRGLRLGRRIILALLALALFAAMGYLLGTMVQDLHLQIPAWIRHMGH